MYISMKFITGVHVFCWEVGVFNRSSFQSVSYNLFSKKTLCKTYCQSSRRLSVSETSLPCNLVVHINLVIACFVQASDDGLLLKMRIDHHNQQLFRLIN